MDDKTKHRLVGLIVIISILMIFTPILVKNSKRHLSRKYVNQQIKPAAPMVREVLKTPEVTILTPIKPTTIIKNDPSTIAAMPKTMAEDTIKLQQQETLTQPSMPTEHSQPYSSTKQHSMVLQHAMAKQHAMQAQQHLKLNQPIHVKIEKHIAVKVNPIKVKPKMVQNAKKKFVPHLMPKNLLAEQQHKHQSQFQIKNYEPHKVTNQYWVQVASLSNFKNAQALAAKLKARGYRVYLKNITTSTGDKLLKVMVINSSGMQQAQLLRQKLAKEMNLKGVIVKDGVA